MDKTVRFRVSEILYYKMQKAYGDGGMSGRMRDLVISDLEGFPGGSKIGPNGKPLIETSGDVKRFIKETSTFTGKVKLIPVKEEGCSAEKERVILDEEIPSEEWEG